MQSCIEHDIRKYYAYLRHLKGIFWGTSAVRRPQCSSWVTFGHPMDLYEAHILRGDEKMRGCRGLERLRWSVKEPQGEAPHKKSWVSLSLVRSEATQIWGDSRFESPQTWGDSIFFGIRLMQGMRQKGAKCLKFWVGVRGDSLLSLGETSSRLYFITALTKLPILLRIHLTQMFRRWCWQYMECPLIILAHRQFRHWVGMQLLVMMPPPFTLLRVNWYGRGMRYTYSGYSSAVISCRLHGSCLVSSDCGWQRPNIDKSWLKTSRKLKSSAIHLIICAGHLLLWYFPFGEYAGRRYKRLKTLSRLKSNDQALKGNLTKGGTISAKLTPMMLFG